MKEQDLKVVYPSEEQMKFQVDVILDKGLQSQVSWADRMKEIWIGPGFSVVFYRAKAILAGSFFIYLAVLFLCSYMGSFVSNEEYFVILAFPMLHLIFHMLSYWADEQEAIIELKESFHYSFHQIVGLRMFYVSILSAVFNCLLMGSLTPFHQMGKVGMVGLSSLFLFAVLTLFLREKTNGLQPVMMSTGVWILVCVLASIYGEWLTVALFEVMPLVAHLMMVCFSFGLFIYYYGKVEKKYAYACEY